MPFTQLEAMDWMEALLNLRREIEEPGWAGNPAGMVDDLIEGVGRDAEAGGFYSALEQFAGGLAAKRPDVVVESAAEKARRLADENSSAMTMGQTREKWEKSIFASAMRGFRSREFSRVPGKPSEAGGGYPFDYEEDAEPYAAMMRAEGFDAKVKPSDGSTRFVVRVRW